jgi:hypothetical protein
VTEQGSPAGAAGLCLLDGTSVAAWLDSRGHRSDGGVRRLAGGVSGAVFGVGDHSVVKQSLPRLAVADEWLADPKRLLHEAYALRLAATLTPDAVPSVMDVDADRLVLLLERAPLSWLNWRARLLTTGADGVAIKVAARLGDVLGIWHAATSACPADLAPGLASAARSFVELRLDPFYFTVAARLPELAAPVQAAAARLVAASRPVLVHGDFSPKNVLFDEENPGRLWVLDFEVAHLGAGVFDVAFLLAHLVCKGAYRPGDAAVLAQCGRAFLAAYAAAVPPPMHPAWADVAEQLACLLLARVHGKSPAAYLSPIARAAIDTVARRLMRDPGPDAGAAWAYLHDAGLGRS